MNSQILDRVVASGICGIKKAELKKIYGKECEDSLETLAKDDKIVVDSKGIAHYVWSKENYISHLSEHDPKFKIISRLVKNLENTINQMKVEESAKQEQRPVDFKMHFDHAIVELSSSLGWVPFVGIRERICKMLGISQESFYSLALELIESNHGEYEISTGGQEGIHVRGLLHGYIRRL
ncbi:MAG: hypothetical protein QXE84_02800 [Candidatus Nitrosotenuis sp.]|uniref:Uncharacterized protein n=1 Tax=Candidatus Nitrosotenuis uzonensis TaxID=1407055 RepID=A0A812EYP2_9ARCH|nr:hypothetical protein [Candidatus Nitrosotenuis uzonensis]MCA2003601.1 hypothetical protein [Candidatus Nitrosotenuis sp.]CAE6484345.1 conserved hypothetical protein [Candidatus Nitrosotenuis uzonensis]